MDTAANQELTKHQALINLAKWRGSSRMGLFFFWRRPSGVRSATPLRAEMNNDHVVAVACRESFDPGRHKRYGVNLIRELDTGAQTYPFTATSLTTVGVLINPGSVRIYILTGPSHKSGSDICFITVTSCFLLLRLHLKRHRCAAHSINDVPPHHRRGCFSSRPQRIKQSAFASATRSKQLPESFQFVVLITALSMVGFWPSVWNKAKYQREDVAAYLLTMNHWMDIQMAHDGDEVCLIAEPPVSKIHKKNQPINDWVTSSISNCLF